MVQEFALNLLLASKIFNSSVKSVWTYYIWIDVVFRKLFYPLTNSGIPFTKSVFIIAVSLIHK